MRLVIQRVSNASCTVDGCVTGKIEKGYMILVGLTESDTLEEIKLLVKKTIGLRVFSDEQGKMNKSIIDVGGSILAISQFTLYGDTSHGNRPSFIMAERPELANELYLKMKELLTNEGIVVKTGVFGADMKINVLNYVPVTVLMNSKEL